MRRFCGVSLMAFLATAVVPQLQAAPQGLDLILSDAACQDCRVHLDPVWKFELEGPGEIGGLSAITRLDDGRYVLVDAYADHELVVFSPMGRFLQRVGRRGEGPGEFQSIVRVHAAGGLLHVFDAQLRRHTVLSGNLTVMATRYLPGFMLGDDHVIGDSLLLTNRHILSQEHVGTFLHVIDAEGDIVRSIDDDPGGFRFDVSDEVYMRKLAPASSGGFWSAHRVRFRVDEWNLDGTPRRTIIRQAPWFPDHVGELRALDPTSPPMPRLLGVREDDLGHLWLLVRVADDDWAQSLVPIDAPAHPELGRYRPGAMDRAFDTVVEVIDLESGTLLDSTRFDEALFHFLGQDQVVSSSFDEEGHYQLHLWQLSLQKPTERRDQ